MKLILVIFALLVATSADACSAHRRHRGETYGALAYACDRVTGSCVRAMRYFRNPVWQ